MCQDCKRRAANLHRETVTAIEAHRAEIVELFTQINKQANGDLVSNARAAMKKDASDEEFAILFSPYIVGFILGSSGIRAEQADHMLEMFAGGMGDGAACYGAREVH